MMVFIIGVRVRMTDSQILKMPFREEDNSFGKVLIKNQGTEGENVTCQTCLGQVSKDKKRGRMIFFFSIKGFVHVKTAKWSGQTVGNIGREAKPSWFVSLLSTD
jgi:hypothetical protein